VHLHQIAQALGLALADIAQRFAHKDAIAEAWFDRADQALLAVPSSPGWESLDAPERLHAAVFETYLDLQGHSLDRRQALEQGLIAVRHLGQRQNEGAILGNLGLAYRALGEVRRAIEHYEQALAISRAIGDRRGEGAHLGNLGLAYSELGRIEEARQVWTLALRIFEAIESPHADSVRGLLAGLDGNPFSK
jgi:tetratricopeptide (TPR) repeat protein